MNFASETVHFDAPIERAYFGLLESETPLPFATDPGLPQAVQELEEWLDDESQWASAFSKQWVSLLDDLLASQRAAQEHLGRFLAQPERAWQELASCRSHLNSEKATRVPDQAIRRRLQRSVEALKQRMLQPAILEAIWDDLLEVSTFAAARIEGRRLWLFIDFQGLDPKGMGTEMRRILDDESVAIKNARGEAVGPDDHGESAGLALDKRVALCRSLLQASPRHVDAVIWLKYTLAPLQAGKIELGEAVSLFSASFLRTLLRGDEGELPPELQEDPDRSHLMLLANGPMPNEEGAEDELDEEVPEALVRVVVGETSTNEALQLARETAELVVSLASLQGGDPSIWLLTESYVRYYDGHEHGASFHHSPVTRLSIEHRQALRSDAMDDLVEEWADDLPDHLPVRSANLRQAGQLALWLRRSRETWEPGRIMLCDRIFEQIAGLAGISDGRRFTSEFLRTSWSLRRIRLEIGNCWRAIYAARLGIDKSSEIEAWEEIKNNPCFGFELNEQGRYTIDLRGFLLHTDLLLERLDPAGPLFERISLLDRRTRSGRDAAAWAKELMADFDAFQGRERRVRNALVHGGPVSDEMAKSILLFVDWLAAEALHAAVKGIVAEKDLVDHFLDRRDEYERSFASLTRNADPVDALFW